MTVPLGFDDAKAATRRQALRAAAAAALALAGVAGHLPALAQAMPASGNKVVFQVTDNDPGRWNLLLNNMENLRAGVAPEPVEIELVAYGPGIHMMKADSPVKARVEAAAQAGVKLAVCQNTMAALKLQPSDMLPQAGYVPAGVVEVMRNQQQGWSYIRN